MNNRQLSVSSEYLLILGGCAVLVVLVLAEESLSAIQPLAAVRALLGLLYTLFLPGYVMQAALFPARATLSFYQRLALAFALSIAVLPIYYLALEYLPLPNTPLIVTLILALHTLIFATLARQVDGRLAREKRRTLAVPNYAALPRWGRLAVGVSSVLLVVALVASVSAFLLPGPAQFFTEFYLEDAQGTAQAYPNEVVIDDPFTLRLGFTNREGQTMTYRAEVLYEGSLLLAVPSITLADDETYEQALDLTLDTVGDDQLLIFHLYEEGGTSPLQSLQFALDVNND